MLLIQLLVSSMAINQRQLCLWFYHSYDLANHSSGVRHATIAPRGPSNHSSVKSYSHLQLVGLQYGNAGVSGLFCMWQFIWLVLQLVDFCMWFYLGWDIFPIQ